MIKSFSLASKNTGELIEFNDIVDSKSLNFNLIQKINHFLDIEFDYEFVKLELVFQRSPSEGRIDFDFTPKK